MCNAWLPNLVELQDKARAINRRVLEAERAGQGAGLASPAFDRIAHPTVDADGRRIPALSTHPAPWPYDLRRLRLAGLIRRVEHTNRYVLAPDGIKFAVFYTKLHHRLLRPLTAADQPPAPPGLRHALDTLSQHVDDYINRARLGKAA